MLHQHFYLVNAKTEVVQKFIIWAFVELFRQMLDKTPAGVIYYE